MTTKHLLNTTASLVHDSLTGLSYQNPATTLTADNTTILTSLAPRVHLLCGGGAGHAPAHSAFVGEGMLSAAVEGQTFASPNSKQVERGITRLLHSPGNLGVLVVVKNYTGDVLQFGVAKERYLAQAKGTLGGPGIRMLVVGDDVSIPRSAGRLTGRRGLAGTTLVYKISGALARTGASLDEVEGLAKLVAERTGTIGVGLEHCHVPSAVEGAEAAVKSESYLRYDEVEIGMGIHNEPGYRKVSPIPTTAKLVEDLVAHLVDTEDAERSYLNFKHDGQDSVILLVNNLGGLPDGELKVVVKETCALLATKKIHIQRLLAGTYMTALNLPGFSITLVLLPREPLQLPGSSLKLDTQMMLECLDAPTEAPGWPWHFKGVPVAHVEADLPAVPQAQVSTVNAKDTLAPIDPPLFLLALEASLHSIIAAEPKITHYDTLAGDGDAGHTLLSGAQAILQLLTAGKFPKVDLPGAMLCIAQVAEEKMGGTSGGLYAIFFNALAKTLGDVAREKGVEVAGIEVWALALERALKALYAYTLARPPSRTLVDPLAAFISTLSSTSSFTTALDSAVTACDATITQVASVGRAAYVDQANLKSAGIPDAGAYGVVELLRGIQSVL